MSDPIRSSAAQIACLALASAASAGLGLLEPGLPVPVAAGLSALWAACGTPRFGAPALALAAPVLALTPWGGVDALVAWACAGFAVTLIIMQLRVPDPESLRVLRAELRDAEHERKLLHRHIQRYPALLEACLELSAARELGHFANVLCQRAREMLPEVREVQVYLGSGGEQSCRASSDGDGKPCVRVAGADEHYVAAEARALIRRESGSLRMLIPLRADRRQSRDEGDTLRGVLVISLVASDVGDRLALELLGALGRLGGLGLAAVDLVNQARGLALRDDLTGLFGQHEFLRRLEEQSAACRRQGISLGLIMCDMDHLKRFNDEHGHLAGDDALRAVASALTAALPLNSIACRYGGEEFAALVVGYDLTALTTLAQSLCAVIAASTPMAGRTDVRVTASLGVAVARVNQESARAALERADAACYQAKALGRNRVEIAV
jgi:diguanylate cyclase (GGDEF)-like protein